MRVRQQSFPEGKQNVFPPSYMILIRAVCLFSSAGFLQSRGIFAIARDFCNRAGFLQSRGIFAIRKTFSHKIYVRASNLDVAFKISSKFSKGVDLMTSYESIFRINFVRAKSDIGFLPGIKSRARIPDLQWCYFPRSYLNKGRNKHCYSGNKNLKKNKY